MDQSVKILNFSNKSSIKREIFKSSALLSLVVVTVFGIFLSTILYVVETSKARAIMKASNHGVVLFIDGCFSEIAKTIGVLSENREIAEAVALGEVAHRHIKDVYLFVSKVGNNIVHTYSGYENGLLLINDYTPPDGFDSSTRPWYRAAMANKPETVIGLPYQDINSKEWLISTSKAMQLSDGRYGAVVVIDSCPNIN